MTPDNRPLSRKPETSLTPTSIPATNSAPRCDQPGQGTLPDGSCVVVAAPPSSVSELPATGADEIRMALAAGAFLGLGAIAVWAGRRNRNV